MGLSINTNVGALVALRNLNNVTGQLDATQKRVSTGLRVSSAEEDASVFAVAQGVRSNLKAYEAVTGALSGAKGLLSTAISGATATSNLMADIKEKLTQLSDDAISDEQREIYTKDLKGQIDQARQFLEQSNYNGKNLLGTDLKAAGYDAADPATWAAAAGASVIGDISGGQITIRSADLLAGGAVGGTADGATGWIAFASLVYTTADDDVRGSIIDDPTVAGNARTSLGANQARAALADLDANGARVDSFDADNDPTTAAVESVFDGAWAAFNREVNLALGTLGTDLRFIEARAEFNTELRDAVEEGLGSLVDADMARESARLQALQTKQQLSIQTLSIANQAPTVLLSLFQ